MPTTKANADLVAHCGLYCGACKSYVKGKCKGCHENSKTTWCLDGHATALAKLGRPAIKR